MAKKNEILRELLWNHSRVEKTKFNQNKKMKK